MTHEDLVTIVSYGSLPEASIAKGALDAENIGAYLMSAETVNTLWYYGPALGGVKLQVAGRDADRAVDVLTAARSTSIGPWQCPHCSAEVDEGFETCWSCGRPAGQLAASAGSDPAGDVQRGPVAEPSSDEPDIIGEATLSTTDITAARAWRAAVFGIAFLPLLVYSLFLIVKLVRQELSPAARRQFYGALAIILSVVALFVLVLIVHGLASILSIAV